MLDPRQTVANLVLDHSVCAAVFQRHVHLENHVLMPRFAGREETSDG